MSNDVESVVEMELARNKIFLTPDAIKLFVDDTTYEFPRWYSTIKGKDLAGYLARHDEAKYAMLNDGKNPVQLQVLAENRAKLETQLRAYTERQKLLREQELWCGWLNPEI